MRILKFPTIATDKHHMARLAVLRLAWQTWFHSSFHSDHGYSIEGNEIYWSQDIGPADGAVDVGVHPALSVGLRQGSSEGWIVTVSACLQKGASSAYLPIYLIKLWTPEAAGLLSSVILQASYDALQPEALIAA